MHVKKWLDSCNCHNIPPSSPRAISLWSPLLTPIPGNFCSVPFISFVFLTHINMEPCETLPLRPVSALSLTPARLIHVAVRVPSLFLFRVCGSCPHTCWRCLGTSSVWQLRLQLDCAPYLAGWILLCSYTYSWALFWDVAKSRGKFDPLGLLLGGSFNLGLILPTAHCPAIRRASTRLVGMAAPLPTLCALGHNSPQLFWVVCGVPHKHALMVLTSKLRVGGSAYAPERSPCSQLSPLQALPAPCPCPCRSLQMAMGQPQGSPSSFPVPRGPVSLLRPHLRSCVWNALLHPLCPGC